MSTDLNIGHAGVVHLANLSQMMTQILLLKCCHLFLVLQVCTNWNLQWEYIPITLYHEVIMLIP